MIKKKKKRKYKRGKRQIKQREKIRELKLELGIDEPRVSSAKKKERLLESDQVRMITTTNEKSSSHQNSIAPLINQRNHHGWIALCSLFSNFTSELSLSLSLFF